MIILSTKDSMGTMGTCTKCASDVIGYTCNYDLINKRPEANKWDWWYACSNELCSNHYGEGVFQNTLDWCK